MSYINNRTLHDCRYRGFGSPAAFDVESAMPHMTAEQVESHTGGILLSGPRNAAIAGISIDTRTLQPGDLFFAIRGPNNDGHAYLSSAIEKGAIGIVIDMQGSPPANIPPDKIILQVPDTHRALKDLAACARRQWRGSLIAITGSMGKTTTKEFVAQVLQTEYSVYRSPGNYNNLFGLPLSLFGLTPDDHIGIFEMGMSAPGEIAEMCRIARPDIGILTNVAPVHLEFFGSIEEIARAKGELAQALMPDGIFIYNADDPLVGRIAENFGGKKRSFGRSSQSDFQAKDIEITGLEETRFGLVHEGVSLRATIPLAGVHYVMNLLPAVAMAHHYRIPMEQVLESLRHLAQPGMRGRITRSHRGFTLIDDSYNSNPRALMQMVETLSLIPGFRRKIVVAGEMLELGKESTSLHYTCGEWTARHGIDVIIAVRGDAEAIARGARATGMDSGQIHFFPEVEPSIHFVTELVKNGDLILVKASRGVRADRIAQALRECAEGQVN